jgi:hypothetical protein
MSLGELLRTKSSEYELLAEWHGERASLDDDHLVACQAMLAVGIAFARSRRGRRRGVGGGGKRGLKCVNCPTRDPPRRAARYLGWRSPVGSPKSACCHQRGRDPPLTGAAFPIRHQDEIRSGRVGLAERPQASPDPSRLRHWGEAVRRVSSTRSSPACPVHARAGGVREHTQRVAEQHVML